jgi:hypothetical protein
MSRDRLAVRTLGASDERIGSYHSSTVFIKLFSSPSAESDGDFCKYLGLAMDSKLQWKEHLYEVRRKATKTVNALSCLGGST